MRSLKGLTVIFLLVIGILVYQTLNLKIEVSEQAINVYNWGDYIDEGLLTKFEEETGIKVNYEIFDSNEAMYAKISQGAAYDVVIPSEYMVEKMIKEDAVKEIDKTKIANFDAVDPRVLGTTIDPEDKYSIPYFWGTVGIVYNERMLNELGLDIPKTWADLWKPEYKNSIAVMDSSRDVFMMALEKNGYSQNSTDPDEVQKAYNDLSKLQPNIRAFIGDEIKNIMISEEVPIGISWSGGAVEMLDENPDLRYIIPEEGTNMWIDFMVIPKTSKNTEGAYKFINFLLEHENALTNAEYVGYSSPVTSVDDELDQIDEFDALDFSEFESFAYLGKEYEQKYNEYFLQVKMLGANQHMVAFSIAVLIIIVGSFYVWKQKGQKLR
ncbi:MAG: ABC transporter substrate-binding protein [Mycoplasmatales bacterium]